MTRRQFTTDCEGPVSKNDNAQELMAYFVPEGGDLFAKISKYDDYLADIVQKPGYKAGDTLRLILPFLRAYGATNLVIEEYSARHILLVPGAKGMLRIARDRMPSFIISTSYRPYIQALCEVIGFPAEQTYCTELDIDRYAIPDSEMAQLKKWVQEIHALPMIEWSAEATSLDDLSPSSKDAVRRLNTIFWEEMPSMVVGRMLEDVNPIGGVEKARALRDSLQRTGIPPEEALYVGDSITDVQAFQWIRQNGGLAISFNGNRYALRSVSIACMADHTLVMALLADVFARGGKRAVMELVGDWNHSTIRCIGADPSIVEDLLQRYPDELPTVALISDENREILTEESERIRKSVRGEEVGRLG